MIGKGSFRHVCAAILAVFTLGCLYSFAIRVDEMFDLLHRTLSRIHIRTTELPSCADGPNTDTLGVRQKGECYSGLPPLCPIPPPDLRGAIPVDQSNVALEEILAENPDVQNGGQWNPKACTSPSKIAILVPFRDRHNHLRIFLRHIHPLLRKQMLDYTIYIIEQTEGEDFNRGFLFNVGVTEASRDDSFDCFVFHDVDLLTEDDRNLYHCHRHPTRLCATLSKWNYTDMYPRSFGGVSVLTRADYLKVNGFNNDFHGWGGEDDDFRYRLLRNNLRVLTVPYDIGRCTSLNHEQAPKNPHRFRVEEIGKVEGSRRGLSTATYQLMKAERRPLYTWVLIRPIYST